jgi:hypothetical protein
MPAFRPRRRTGRVLLALGVVVSASPLLSGASAGADPTATGSLSGVISQGARPECSTAKYQPTDGYRCPPAAMAAAVLATGKVLFWDGLEGMNKVDLSVVSEFGDVAQNDQSRVATFSGGSASFSTPGNQSADGNGTLAEPPNPLLPPNPVTPSGAGIVDSPGNDYDLFCSPLVQLADGTILAAGGTKYYLEPGVTDPTTGKSYGVSELQGLKATRIFDPATNSWRNIKGGDLNFGRWYPTMVTLPNGHVFIASGVTKLIKPLYTDGRSPFDSGRNVVETETYDPHAQKWTLNKSALPGTDPTLADASQQSLPLFARLHLLPDGHVYYDAAGQTFNPAGEGYDEAGWVNAKVYDPATQAWRNLTADTATGLPLVDNAPVGFRGSGFDVTLPLRPAADGSYPTMQVFNGGGVVGPTPGNYLGDTSTTINTIDTAHGDALSSANGPTLLNRRWYGSAVALPDGEVFVTNGADRDEVDVPGSGTPVLQTELIDPTAGTSTAGPSLDSAHGRTYHNTAILLPDGRVLIGGHAPIATGYGFQDDTGHDVLGLSSAESDSTFQIYSPPYLSYGPRPRIDDVNSWTPNNSALKIESDDARSIGKVVLVRNPAMTHLTDGDQRTVELRITGRDDDEVTAAVPNGNVVPPGPYMLFVERPVTVNGAHKWIPSVSRQVFVGATAPSYSGSFAPTSTSRVRTPSSNAAPRPVAATAPRAAAASPTMKLHARPVAVRRPYDDWRALWIGVAAVLIGLRARWSVARRVRRAGPVRG